MPTHKGEDTWANLSLTGMADPSPNFWGSGAVARKLSLQAFAVYGGHCRVRGPSYKAEGIRDTRSLTELRRPLRDFFEVRFGMVKVVSSSFGSIWGSVPNYGCLPTRATHSPIGLGWEDPCTNF